MNIFGQNENMSMAKMNCLANAPTPNYAQSLPEAPTRPTISGCLQRLNGLSGNMSELIGMLEKVSEDISGPAPVLASEPSDPKDKGCLVSEFDDALTLLQRRIARALDAAGRILKHV